MKKIEKLYTGLKTRSLLTTLKMIYLFERGLNFENKGAL